MEKDKKSVFLVEEYFEDIASELPTELGDVLINEISKDEMVEEDYELIKNDPNYIWIKYDEKIKKITNSLGYWKNFDKDDLYQQSYIYFVGFCKNYNPYYNDNFIPFDKYFFKNLIIKLRAYIQSYYFKRKREQPNEFTESSMGFKDNSSTDDKMYIEHLYEHISEKQKRVLELSAQGYKQKEIGEILDISQSRVSVIRKRTLKKLKEKFGKQ